MLEAVVLIATGGVLAGGYWRARTFVRDRLRFVDAVYRRSAPYVAGAGAALVAAPVAWLLPMVGAGSALLFGASVGLGVAAGTRDLKRLPGSRS